jgi:hypothetical protein
MIEGRLLGRLLDMASDPIRYLAIGDRVANHLDEGVGLEPSCLQPLSIESPRREILLIIGMELTRQGETNLVYETGQIQPAGHCFPGTPGMDHIIHKRFTVR